MLIGRDNVDYIQCSQCGHVYQVEQKHKVEDLYVNETCPSCNSTRGLYMGTNLDYFYELADITLDSRYYQYTK
jgi:rubredoxin